MKNKQIQAIAGEFEKTRHSVMVGASFIAFALGPVMGGFIMILLGNPQTMGSSALSTKAQLMNFSVDWNSYLEVLSQVVGVGGVIIFGFVASWLFGREYSDGTFRDLLALPISRSKILNAKFVVYIAWCVALVISNLLLGIIVGSIISLPDFGMATLAANLEIYFTTSLMVIILGTPISFFSLWGRGYMAPLGFVVLAIVFSQIIGAIGAGHYFPWAIPGIFSGMAGDYKTDLNDWSYVILVLTSAAGYGASQWWWSHADQH